MKSIFFIVAAILITLFSSCSRKTPENFIFVKGGDFKHPKTNYYGKGTTVKDFYIGKYELTQKDWKDVMGNNPSEFKGDNMPVESVSWYDCIEYCNKRSIKEGLTPYYTIDRNKKDPDNKSELDSLKWTVTINDAANGYRLPTEAEWEYAASGGRQTKNYTYSGSSNIGDVAWFWQNSGAKYLTGNWSWPALVGNENKPQSIGIKKSNELGIYDMSGNVREWCWDRDMSSGASTGRIWKGGGWIGGDFCCEPSFRAGLEANGKGADQGFRLCRGL